MNTANRRGSRLAPAIGAFAGLVIGCAVASRLHLPPAANQPPGHALENAFDPRTDVLRLAVLCGAALLGGAVARVAFGGSRWAGARPGPPEAAARRPEPHRPSLLGPAVVAHALAVWTLLAAALGPAGIWPLVLLVALAGLSLALAFFLGAGKPGAGAAFLGAACPILALGFLGTPPVPLSLVAAAAGFALPVLARAAAARRPGVARAMRAATLVVLLPGSVTALAAATVMRVPRGVDTFEDGHALLPASEYLRGERPYRDIVPGHGLLADGLLAAAQLRLFGDDYRGLKRGEKVFGAFFWPAFYAVGYAATGSPGFALGGLLFAFVAFSQYSFPRAVVSVWILALALYASRSKKRGAWLGLGAALPVAVCVAVDFSAYAACASAVALWIARGRRLAHLRRLVLGAGLSGAVIGLMMLAYGILGGFVRTTFVFVPSLLPVYAMGFPAFPTPRGAADWMALPGDETAVLYGFVGVSLVLLGAFLPRAPRVGSRARAMLPVCAWVVAAMLSVLERQHVGYALLGVPIGVLLVARWAQGSCPWASVRTIGSAAVPALLLWIRSPVLLLGSVAQALAHPPAASDLPMLQEPLRARGGVFFRGADAELVAATGEMMRQAGFGKDDTWLDFASVPGLYYLFDRDCPIRYYEVGFYETEAAQREVIAAVERNPGVRAVLMTAPLGVIDGVPNAKRAPLVAAFIRERFQPFYRGRGVEFWLRREAPLSGADRGASASSPP